jgi:hypothetical protein
MDTGQLLALGGLRLATGGEGADPLLLACSVDANAVAVAALDNHALVLLSASQCLDFREQDRRWLPLMDEQGIPSRTRSSTQRVENPSRSES